MNTIYKTDFPNLNLIHRGKVRDIFDLGDKLLFVATDRISAFDVIMDTPIPGKGSILSGISSFWFSKTTHIIPNHFLTSNVDDYPEECQPYKDELTGRSMIVKKCKPLPIEAVVRGYLAGSGWKEYKVSSTVCGIPLPTGILEFGQLPEPIFTPATKEEVGHDENIDFERMISIVGLEISNKVKSKAIELYNFAWNYMNQRGIILADTKFEFGIDSDNNLILIDEALTPDSSRFWLKEKYEPGKSQYNFDKQVLRDYLETLDWNKMPPPPQLPDSIVALTLEKYNEAYNRITG